MRSFFVLLVALFMLGACSKKSQVITTSDIREPAHFEESGLVELQLNKEDVALFADRESEIWKQARRLALTNVTNKIFNRDLIVQPVDGYDVQSSGLGSVIQNGFLADMSTSDTGDFIQKFRVHLSFDGDNRQGGQILVQEEHNFLGAINDIVYAVLYQAVPDDVPAYAVIAEPVDELSGSFVRVIGLAEVKQIQNSHVTVTNPDRSNDEARTLSGTLCSLEIVVSDREIEAGDRIFLANAEFTALDPESQSADAPLETVVVQPAYSDKVQEPAAQK